jgi:hypothetical protein
MTPPRLLGILGLAPVIFMLSDEASAAEGKAIREPVKKAAPTPARTIPVSTPTPKPHTARGGLLKLDLDADFNGDGVVDNTDKTDNGLVQTTPPGLILHVGEVQRAVIRAYRYPKVYRGELMVAISVDNINRAEKSGDFSSRNAEIANAGGIRVWEDAQKTRLLLDSRNPEERIHPWMIQFGVPTGVPSVVFVEGVAPSQFSGDIRLMVSARPVTKPPQPDWVYYDHILLTVEPTGHAASSRGGEPAPAGRK